MSLTQLNEIEANKMMTMRRRALGDETINSTPIDWHADEKRKHN